MIDFSEQYDLMVQAEAERLADVFFEGVGDSKINSAEIVILFDMDPFEVYKDIAKRVTTILDEEGYESMNEEIDDEDEDDGDDEEN